MTDAIHSTQGGIFRRLTPAIIVSSIVGIVLGIAVLIWPGHALRAIAVLLGIGVIFGGLFRIAAAVLGPFSAGTRILLGVLGVITLICGVIALFAPGAVLLLLALFIGIGWIIGGIHDLIAGLRHRYTIGPRWFALISAVISIIAGIVVILLPGLSLLTFAIFAGIMLIVVSVAELAMLPRARF